MIKNEKMELSSNTKLSTLSDDIEKEGTSLFLSLITICFLSVFEKIF